MAGKALKLLNTPPAIPVSKKRWQDISTCLPAAPEHEKGRRIVENRDQLLFEGILLVLWNDAPVGGKTTPGYKSNERMQFFLNEWAFEGLLQKMWAKYLAFLTETDIKRWLKVFASKPTRQSRPRRSMFWFIDLARILVKEARKRNIKAHTAIRLPKHR